MRARAQRNLYIAFHSVKNWKKLLSRILYFLKKYYEILIQQFVFSRHIFQVIAKFMFFNTVRWKQEKLFFLTSSDENEQNRDKKLHLKQRRPHTCSHFQMISNFFSESNRNSFSKWACFTTFLKIKSEWKFLFGKKS